MMARANSRSKLVFVNRYFHPDQSATSQLLTDLTIGLSERGRDVHVICSRQQYDDSKARLLPLESTRGVTIHRVWTTRFGRDRLLGRALDYASFYLFSAIALVGLLRRGDTVVAKTDPPLISIVAMAAANVRKARLINWLQDIFPEVASRLGANPLPGTLDALLHRLRDGSLRAAMINVVLGERMKEFVEGRGIPAHKICIIENWADIAPQPPILAESSKLRARSGLTGKFVVGYAGNLGRAHEFLTLLGAAEILRSDQRIVFLMIGGGVGMSQLSESVKLRGLGNFRFLPYQPRASLADSLAAADVHVVSLLPAMEGLIVPSKFYGILAAARPIIFVGDADGELGRTIESAQCGVVNSVGDASGLAETLRDLMSEPSKRRIMGDNGYRRYGERYTARRAFDRWMEVLETHVGGDVSVKPLSHVDGVRSQAPSSQ